jgi:glycosyltransferase involved in cell wall biosynthesis
MHFLFIYVSPGVLGGIETLIVRMSRWLVNNGHKVTLLVRSGENWSGALPKEVRCITLGRPFRELSYYWHAKRLWDQFGIERPDIIKGFELESAWIACLLAAIIKGNPKVIAGIYNPLVFRWYYAPKSLPLWDANRLYLHNYLKHIPANARLFCGIDQIEELEEVHQQKGVLWPIPLETTQFEPALRKPKWGKIVSIGRLSPMKEYNLYMIDVVKTLRDRGHDVTWSVYGTGEYETTMRERIRKAGLEQFISMEGTAPYARFRKVLEDAYVFVGMGTSILEAALFKVPNVNALGYDREGMTTGPVYRFPRGSIGPGIHAPTNLKVVDEIERILRLSPAEYRAEEDRVGSHVEVHEMKRSMNDFLQLVRDAGPIKIKKSLYLTNYPLWFLRCVMKRLVRPREISHPGSTRPVTTANAGQPG